MFFSHSISAEPYIPALGPEAFVHKMWHLGTMPVVDECHDLVVNALLWTALALVAVGLRLFTRGIIVKRIGWDDYLMAAAMVSCSSTKVSPSRFQSVSCCSPEGLWPMILQNILNSYMARLKNDYQHTSYGGFLLTHFRIERSPCNQVCSIGFLVAVMYRMSNILFYIHVPSRLSGHALLTQ